MKTRVVANRLHRIGIALLCSGVYCIAPCPRLLIRRSSVRATQDPPLPSLIGTGPVATKQIARGFLILGRGTLTGHSSGTFRARVRVRSRTVRDPISRSKVVSAIHEKPKKPTTCPIFVPQQ